MIELVLVLLLIGVSLIIALPNIDKALEDREARVTALGLAAAARDLRSRALFDGVPQELLLNMPQNSYFAAPSAQVRLPAEIKFISVEGGEAVDRGVRKFYFFPNGSSLGGEIVIGGEKASSYRIRLDGLTGGVEVRRGERS